MLNFKVVTPDQEFPIVARSHDKVIEKYEQICLREGYNLPDKVLDTESFLGLSYRNSRGDRATLQLDDGPLFEAGYFYVDRDLTLCVLTGTHAIALSQFQDKAVAIAYCLRLAGRFPDALSAAEYGQKFS